MAPVNREPEQSDWSASANHDPDYSPLLNFTAILPTDPDTTTALWRLVRDYNSPAMAVNQCYITFARKFNRKLTILLKLGRNSNEILQDWKNTYRSLELAESGAGGEAAYKSATAQQPTLFVHVHYIIAKILLDPPSPESYTGLILPYRVLQPEENWPELEVTMMSGTPAPVLESYTGLLLPYRVLQPEENWPAPAPVLAPRGNSTHERSRSQSTHGRSRSQSTHGRSKSQSTHGHSRLQSTHRSSKPKLPHWSSKLSTIDSSTSGSSTRNAMLDEKYTCAYYLDQRTVITPDKANQMDLCCGFKWSSPNGIFPYLTVGLIQTQKFNFDWQEQGCKNSFSFGVNALRARFQLRLRAMENQQDAETLIPLQDEIGHLVCIIGMNSSAIYHLVARQPSTSTAELSQSCPWDVDRTSVYEGKDTTILMENLRRAHYWGLQRYGEAVKADLEIVYCPTESSFVGAESIVVGTGMVGQSDNAALSEGNCM